MTGRWTSGKIKARRTRGSKKEERKKK